MRDVINCAPVCIRYAGEFDCICYGREFDWFNQVRYLDVDIVHSHKFKCSVDRAATSSFAKVWQIYFWVGRGPATVARLGAILPCWRLHLAFLWQVSPPSAFRRRWHMHRLEDPYPFWRPEFLRCRPLDLEQLAAGTATASHWDWRIVSITEDIFVCVGTAEMAAH